MYNFFFSVQINSEFPRTFNWFLRDRHFTQFYHFIWWVNRDIFMSFSPSIKYLYCSEYTCSIDNMFWKVEHVEHHITREDFSCCCQCSWLSRLFNASYENFWTFLIDTVSVFLTNHIYSLKNYLSSFNLVVKDCDVLTAIIWS